MLDTDIVEMGRHQAPDVMTGVVKQNSQSHRLHTPQEVSHVLTVECQAERGVFGQGYVQNDDEIFL